MRPSLSFKNIRSARLRLQTPEPKSSEIQEYIWVIPQLAWGAYKQQESLDSNLPIEG
jgi:hypothetical protein